MDTYMRTICGILFIALAVTCVSKKTWHGKYITITDYRLPKEDFMADGKVVVVWLPKEYDRDAQSTYRFCIMQGDKEQYVFECGDYPIFEGITYKWFIVSGEYSGIWDRTGTLTVQSPRTIVQMYETEPSYETVKKDMIRLITGEELSPGGWE